MTDLRKAYRDHKSNSKRRGIPFRLTYEQWLGIWKASGKLHLRGRKRGQYCMARINDKGAYEVGNVEIILVQHNHSEAYSNMTPKAYAKWFAAVNVKGAANREKWVQQIRGKPLSFKHRRAMSLARKKYLARLKNST